MVKRDRDDEIERTRRLIRRARSEALNSRVSFDNLTTERQEDETVTNPKNENIEDENITIETEIEQIGIYTDANGNEVEETVSTDTKTVTIQGRNKLIELLTGESNTYLESAEVGTGSIGDRRNASSLNSTLNTSSISTFINSNNKLVAQARFNNLNTQTDTIDEIGLKTQDGILVQYDYVDIDFN